MALRTIVSALASLAFVATPAAIERGDHARQFLTAVFDVAKSDMARIDAGRVYSRTLSVRHAREIATLGIVRIGTTPQRYVERLADIAVFKRDPAVLRIAAFSAAPRLGDLDDLTLDEADVRRLRECRTASCDVQLPADAIERFRTDVNWRAADAPQRATDLMRHILVEYVTRYRQLGSAAEMEYADSPTRVAVGSEFTSLVSADTRTWPHIPRLRRHLLEFPSARDDNASDLVYWSIERVHRRPVISVTHLAIVREEHESPVAYAIASKQIYAMHYFDASLGITLLVPDRGASTPVTYVVYLNRSRIDILDGVLGGLARKLVSGKARSLVAEQLERVRQSLESS